MYCSDVRACLAAGRWQELAVSASCTPKVKLDSRSTATMYWRTVMPSYWYVSSSTKRLTFWQIFSNIIYECTNLGDECSKINICMFKQANTFKCDRQHGRDPSVSPLLYNIFSKPVEIHIFWTWCCYSHSNLK